MSERRDRRLFIAVALVMIALVLIAERGRRDTSAALVPSSFRAAPGGGLALYLALEELDLPVARGFESFDWLTPAPTAIALLAPTQVPSPRELERLNRWIEGGGTLVYAARPGDPTLDSLGLEIERIVRPDGPSDEGTPSDPEANPTDEAQEAGATESADSADSADAANSADAERADGGPGFMGTGIDAATAPAVPGIEHPWTAETDTVAGFRFAFEADSRALARALASDSARALLQMRDGAPVLVELDRGAGRVIAWSDAEPLTNRTLGGGAAVIFARAAADVTRGGAAPLIFDEYHHGYREGVGPARATLRFLTRSPAGHAVLQLALVGLALLLLYGRRFGEPLDRPPARRRSPLEHVNALGSAYRQAGARETARQRLIAGLARRLRLSATAGERRRPGALASGDEAAFLAHLGDHLPAGREHAAALAAEWRKGDRANLVTMANEIDMLLAKVRRS